MIVASQGVSSKIDSISSNVERERERGGGGGGARDRRRDRERQTDRRTEMKGESDK